MTTAPGNAEPPKGKAWHTLSAEDLLAQLGSAATGLSAPEASQRLAVKGPNELKEGKRISPLQLFLANSRASAQVKNLLSGSQISLDQTAAYSTVHLAPGPDQR